MQKVLPILFFYTIKFRGYAHYANACINFVALLGDLIFEIMLSVVNTRSIFDCFFDCFLWFNK